MRLPFLVLLALAIFACGAPPPLPSHVPSARRPHVQVQSWEVGADLAARKNTVMTTCRQQGKPDSTCCLLLGMFMQETVHGSAGERDASKDGAGDARNWSAWNFNSSMLKRLGWVEGQGPNLNDDSALADATRWAVKAADVFGEDKFMDFHRGGDQGFSDGCSYGCADYRAQMRAVQAYLLAHPELWIDGQRVGGDVPHV